MNLECDAIARARCHVDSPSSACLTIAPARVTSVSFLARFRSQKLNSWPCDASKTCPAYRILCAAIIRVRRYKWISDLAATFHDISRIDALADGRCEKVGLTLYKSASPAIKVVRCAPKLSAASTSGDELKFQLKRARSPTVDYYKLLVLLLICFFERRALRL